MGSNPLRYTDPSGYCKKSAGDYLHELFGIIKEDEDLIPYYFITYSYGDSGLPCIGSAVGISYSTYNFPFIKTALAVRDDINDDIVDVVIEVAGDYLPSETLENATIFFSNVSDMYEKMVTPLKKCADFFEWLTALSVPAIGETLTFGAPSLITPEGWVVEGGVAVSGTVVVLVEASGAAVFEAAAYGYQRNADKSNEISMKLRNEAKKSKPNQVHHYATNKNKTYTPQLEEVAKKYGLSLDDDWNKDLLPHLGRHANEYHEYVLDSIKLYDEIAQGDRDVFLKLFEALKDDVMNNPEKLYKSFWNGH